MHLNGLKSAECYCCSNWSFDPVEADALVQSTNEAFSLEHIDQSAPDWSVDMIHACYSCKHIT